MDSIAKKQEALKGAFQELIWGDGGLNTLIKGFLDVSTGIISFANDTNALTVGLTALATILTISLLPSIKKFFVTMASGTVALFTNLKQTKSLTQALELMGVTASTTTIAMNLLVGAVALGVMAWNKYKASQEEARQEAISNLEGFKTTNEGLLNQIKSIKDETVSREGLIAILSENNNAYDKEKGQLEDINTLRDEAITKLYEEAKASAKLASEENRAEVRKAKEYLETPRLVTTIPKSITESLTGSQKAFKAMLPADMITFYDEEIKRLELQEKEKGLSDFEIKYLEEAIKERKKYNDEVKTRNDLIAGEIEQQKIANMSQEEWLSYMQKTNEATKEGTEYQTDYVKALEELNTQLDNVQKAVGAFEQAQSEYNENGAISVDTYQELLSYGNEYIDLLIDENGNINTNTNAVWSLYEAKINELAVTKAREIIDIAKTNTKEKKSFDDLAISTDLATDSLWEYVATSAVLSDIDETNAKQAQELINKIDEMRLKTLAGIRTRKDNKKTINDETDAIQKQINTLKDQEKVYDDVISFIQDKVEDYISVLEEARDKEQETLENEQEFYEAIGENIDDVKDKIEELGEKIVEADKEIENLKVQDQIENIQHLQEIELSLIQSQIDELQQQKQIEEDYWQSKIDALNEQNNQLQEQIELETLLQNLAKAKESKKMVYKEGQGYVYATDEEAVASAEKGLQSYYTQQEYQRNLSALESYKSQASNRYDTAISNKQTLLDATNKQYEDRIAELNSTINESYEEQIQRLENQKLVDEEEKARLERNLTTLEEDYKKQGDIIQAHSALMKRNYDDLISYYNNFLTNFETQTESYNNQQLMAKAFNLTGIDFGSGNWQTQLQGLGDFTSNYNTLLDKLGTLEGSKITSNGITIGQKINENTAVKLGNGGFNLSNLASIAGSIPATLQPQSLMAQATGGAGNVTNVSIGNISLPEVKNGKDFVDYLQNFNATMIQNLYTR